MCIKSTLNNWLNSLILEDHIVCHDQEIHFHKAEIDCSTCDFVRVSFDYNSSQFDIKMYEFPFFGLFSNGYSFGKDCLKQ